MTTPSLKTRLVSALRPVVNLILERKAFRGVPNKPLVRALLKQQVWPDGAHYDAATQRLYVPEWDAQVSQGSTGWAVERAGLRVHLDSEQSFRWATDVLGKGLLPKTTRSQQFAHTRWVAETRDFRFYLESVCDLDIAREVFIEREYAWLAAQFEPGSVVWDVGMNVGMASLLFAADSSVHRVYSYEPVPETFAVAREALAANPLLSSKITAEEAGIAGSNRVEKFDYTAQGRAGVGLVGILPTTLRHYDIQPADIKKIDARLLDAAQVLRRIRSENPAAPLYLKCDCEGAEYEIIDRLLDAGMLSEISAAVIECHKGDPEHLAEQLNAAGFATRLDVKVDGRFYHVCASRNPRLVQTS